MPRSPEGLERRRARDRARSVEKNRAYYAKYKERENARCKSYHHEVGESRLAKKAEWRAANRAEENAKTRVRRRENHAAALERDRLRRESGVDRAYQDRWRQENAERERVRAAQWVRDNPDKARAKVARRRAAKIRATPLWADHSAILKIYEEAVRITSETGIPHEVDHIVPLKGRTVCGLHIANNLRVVPQSVNRSKGNRVMEAA